MLKLVQYIAPRVGGATPRPTACGWGNLLLISPRSGASSEKCITQRRHFLFSSASSSGTFASSSSLCTEQRQQFHGSRRNRETILFPSTYSSLQAQSQRAFRDSSKPDSDDYVDSIPKAEQRTRTRKSLFNDPGERTEEIKIEGVMWVRRKISYEMRWFFPLTVAILSPFVPFLFFFFFFLYTYEARWWVISVSERESLGRERKTHGLLNFVSRRWGFQPFVVFFFVFAPAHPQRSSKSNKNDSARHKKNLPDLWNVFLLRLLFYSVLICLYAPNMNTRTHTAAHTDLLVCVNACWRRHFLVLVEQFEQCVRAYNSRRLSLTSAVLLTRQHAFPSHSFHGSHEVL